MGILNILQGMGRGSFLTKSRPLGRSENAKRLQNARRVRALGLSDHEMAQRTKKRFQHDPSHGAGDDDDDSDDDSDAAILTNLEDKSLKEILADANKSNKADYTPIPGNIYKKWAFFGIFSGDCSSSVGQIFIFLIQLLAPVAMLIFWVYTKIDYDATKFWTTEHWTDEKVGWSTRLTIFLKVLFMFLFYLNAVNSNHDEEQNWKTTKLLYDIVDSQSKEDVGSTFYLWLGAFVNCQALIFLCADTWLLMYNCAGPGDVVMNIVGLIFMYKMDDQDSDLVFFGEDEWNPSVMGQILTNSIESPEQVPYKGLDAGFDNMWSQKYPGEDGWAEFKADSDIYEEATNYVGISNPFYTLTSLLAYVATAALPIGYLFVNIQYKP